MNEIPPIGIRVMNLTPECTEKHSKALQTTPRDKKEFLLLKPPYSTKGCRIGDKNHPLCYHLPTKYQCDGT